MPISETVITEAFKVMSREDRLKWRETWKREKEMEEMRKEMWIENNWGDTCRFDESIAGNYLLTFTDF